MVADELRRQADEVIDLADLADRIGRDPKERADRMPRSQERSLIAAPARTGQDAEKEN